MTVQRTQNRGSIRASAAHAGLAGNTLGNTDLQTVRIFTDGFQINLGRFPCQVFFVAGDSLFVAGQLPGFSRSHINFNIVPYGNGLHHGFQVVVTVFPLAQHIQC